MAKTKRHSPERTRFYRFSLDLLIAELQNDGFVYHRFGYALYERWQTLLNTLEPETDPQLLKYKLAALFCHNEEEQFKFYEAFDRVLRQAPATGGADPISPGKIVEPPPPPPTPESKPLHREPEPPPVPPVIERKPAPIPGTHLETPRPGPIRLELRFRDDGYRPWNLPDLEAVVRPLREKEESRILEWDIPATIRKTMRQGGIPHFVTRRRKLAPQYLFLIDQQTTHDFQAAFYAELPRELARRDLDADFFFYHQTPLLCWKDRRDPSTYTTIDRLEVEFQDARLILIGPASGLMAATVKPKDHPANQPFIPARTAYPSPLAFRLRETWPMSALLCPHSPLEWGVAEDILHYLFPVAPANLQGLASLKSQWVDRISFKPGFWQSALPEPVTPPLPRYDRKAESVNEAMYKLRLYLDKPGFNWLAAIAVYPELYWQLTKILHDEAVSSLDVPDESLRTELRHLSLQRMSRLSWLREGRIPDAYREALRARLPAANAAEVRRQLIEVLQLEENTPHPDSYAAKDRAFTLARLDHERMVALEKPDSVRLKAMQEQLRKSVDTEGVDLSDIEDAIGRKLFENLRRLPDVPMETIKHFWVLWVDDNPSNNFTFQDAFAAKHPVRFVNVTNTTQAIDNLRTQHYDLVVSDISRFGDKESGLKMMQKFVELDFKAPTVFFTHPDYVSRHQKELRQLGALAVLTGFEQLRPVLEEALQRKIQENQSELTKIRQVENLQIKARAVCRVVLPDRWGTGFLLEPGDWLLTCCHVLPDAETAARAQIEFVRNEPTGNDVKIIYQLDAGAMFSSPVNQLNYTYIRVVDRSEEPLLQFGHLRPDTSNTRHAGDTHHLIRLDEKGGGKVIESMVVTTEDPNTGKLFYGTGGNKIPGRSGSPLLDTFQSVVAMHQAWQDKQDDRPSGSVGAKLSDIIRDIERQRKEQETSKTPQQPFDIALEKGQFELENGNLDIAEQFFLQALETSDRAKRGAALHGLGKLSLQRASFEQAIRYLEQALDQFQLESFESSQAFVLMDLGKAQRLAGNLDAAEKAYLEAQELLEGLYGNTEVEQADIKAALEGIGKERESEWRQAGKIFESESAQSQTNQSEAPMQSLFTAGALKVLVICAPEDEYHFERLNHHLQRLSLAENLSIFNALHPPSGETRAARARFEMTQADFTLILASVHLVESGIWLEYAAEVPERAKKPLVVALEPIDLSPLFDNLSKLPFSSKNTTLKGFEYPEDGYLVVARDFETLVNQEFQASQPKDKEAMFDLLAKGELEKVLLMLEAQDTEAKAALARWESLRSQLDKTTIERGRFVLERNKLLQTAVALVAPNEPLRAWQPVNLAEVKTAIEKDEMDTAFNLLYHSLEDASFLDLVALSGQYYMSRQDMNSGRINFQEFSLERNKITHALIGLMRRLEQQDSVVAPETIADLNRGHIWRLLEEGEMYEAIQTINRAFPERNETTVLRAQANALQGKRDKAIIDRADLLIQRSQILSQLIDFTIANLPPGAPRQSEKTHVEDLKGSIAKGELKEALTLLWTWVDQPETEKDVASLHAQLAMSQSDYSAGVVAWDEYSREYQTLVDSTLRLINQLQKPDAPPTDTPSREALLALLQNGQLDEALRAMQGIWPEDTEVAILNNRYVRVSKDQLLRLVTHEEYSNAIVQIVERCVALIDARMPLESKGTWRVVTKAKEEVLELIAKTEVLKSLELLSEVTGSRLLTKTTSLQAQFSILQMGVIRGTIEKSFEYQQLTQICREVIELTNELPQSTTTSETAVDARRLKETIGQANLEDVIDELRLVLPANAEVALLAARMKYLKQDYNKGLVDFSNYQSFYHQIAGATLEWLDQFMPESSSATPPASDLETEQFQWEIKNLIAEGKTEAALQLLQKRYPNDTQVLQIMSRYKQNQKNNDLGVISKEEFMSTDTRITRMLLDLLYEMAPASPSAAASPEISEKIKGYLSENDLETAMKLFREHFPGHPEVLQLLGRYHNLQSLKRTGTIPEHEYSRNVSLIIFSALEFLNHLDPNQNLA